MALRAGIRAAGKGNGRLTFVRGPTGVGKTRLAHVVAEEAAAQGFTTLEGRGELADYVRDHGLLGYGA